QAEAVAAAICGESAPFERKPTAIRVKTPSLALNLCPPDLTVVDQGRWVLENEQGTTCRMAFMTQGRHAGYALSGSEAARASELYEAICRDVA
ncbi:MAG: hypothetical protein AB1766_02345, partial [Pseudomonadota bacterium]